MEGTTVDDVHEHVDGLVLSVFEAMRTACQNDADLETGRTSILQQYVAAQSVIDNLKGISRSSTERITALNDASLKYKAAKKRIIDLEEMLRKNKEDIDGRLQTELKSLINT